MTFERRAGGQKSADCTTLTEDENGNGAAATRSLLLSQQKLIGRAITGFIYVYKTDLLQEAANNSNDRGGIGDDEYGHRSIDVHGSNPDARSAQSRRPSAHSVDFRRYLSNPRKGRQSCQGEVKIQLIAEIGQASDKQSILQRRTTVNFIRVAL